MQLNLKDTLTVARFDYRNLVRSAPGVIFLIIYLFTVLQFGTISVDIWPLKGDKKSAMCKLPKDAPPAKLKEAIQKAVPPFSNVTPEAWRFLECERPVLMSIFFLIGLLVVPILVLLLAFNQISGYLHRKSIRYILPKTGRLELYLGLFLSNLKFFTVVSGAVTVVVTIGFLVVGRELPAATVLGYSARIFVALWLSALPIIAFMSMLASMLGSPIVTVFVGAGAYVAIDIVGFLVSRANEYGKVMFYLLPLEPKYWFAYPGWARFLGAAALMLVYTFVYLAIGWLFLRRRNV